MKPNKPLALCTLAMATSFALSTSAAANSASNQANIPYQAVENLPHSRLKTSLSKLPAPVQQKVLNKLSSLGIPVVDTDFIEADDNGEIYYVEMGLSVAPSATVQASTQTLPEIDVFNLHSKPAAANTVYLDFDGGEVSGRAWGGGTSYATLPYDLDGDPASFNDSERARIHEIWTRMADDFAAFDINVTTQAPATFGPNTGWVLFTKDTDANGIAMPSQGAGGVAYVNVWGRSDYTKYQPAFAYYNRLASGAANTMAEAGSHELGHNLGLSHDGTSTTSYFSGLGENLDVNSWAPIMGNSYRKNITQWSIGEYPDANQFQDDIAIITSKLGASSDTEGTQTSPNTLTMDEFGQFSATNREADPSNAQMANKGTIQQGDSDWFQFSAGTGAAQFNANPAWDAFTRESRRGANLDIGLRLYNAQGDVIAATDGQSDSNASLSLDLAEGVYTLEVYGASGPYVSNYASQGHYYLSGYVPPTAPDTTAPDPNPMTFAIAPNAISHDQITMQATTAIDDNGAVVSYLFSCTQGTTNCTDSAWQNSTQFSASNLSAQTQYCFTVQAKDLANNMTLPSASLCATTPAEPLPPATPSSLVATDGQNGSASLHWGDNSDNETGFEIQREKQHKNGQWRATTFITETGENTTSYVDSSDTGVFRYRVRAINTVGASPWSNWAQVTVTSDSSGGGDGEKPCRGNKCTN
ncbi:M12 family metallo-peptidase [Pseudoalteromonas sp. SSDWG2]|uniref:M12 family metallo-peptidase n=1 Tax=Pseudoalteromonas sp. SSDWG2 TaxID=3139391 RepID=UPI003BAC2F51